MYFSALSSSDADATSTGGGFGTGPTSGGTAGQTSNQGGVSSRASTNTFSSSYFGDVEGSTFSKSAGTGSANALSGLNYCAVNTNGNGGGFATNNYFSNGIFAV